MLGKEDKILIFKKSLAETTLQACVKAKEIWAQSHR